MITPKIMVVILFTGLLFVQPSYGQNNDCPPKNEQAKEKMSNFLSKDYKVQSLRDHYGISFSKNPEEDLIAIAGEGYQNVCQQLISNVDWVADIEVKYAIYKIDDHYFLIKFTHDGNDNFKFKSTSILNSDYEGVGAIIDFG